MQYLFTSNLGKANGGCFQKNKGEAYRKWLLKSPLSDPFPIEISTSEHFSLEISNSEHFSPEISTSETFSLELYF